MEFQGLNKIHIQDKYQHWPTSIDTLKHDIFPVRSIDVQKTYILLSQVLPEPTFAKASFYIHNYKLSTPPQINGFKEKTLGRFLTYLVFITYFLIALNAADCSLILRSAAKRSMLEAPKNPSSSGIWLITYWASSGSEIGPP